MPDTPMSLDSDHITAAAQYAADQLATVGFARLQLTPGDMTAYRFVIVAPGPEWVGPYGSTTSCRYYSVSLGGGLGRCYPWTGSPVAAPYAEEKWVHRTTPAGHPSWSARHTGSVVAQFLTALSAELGWE